MPKAKVIKPRILFLDIEATNLQANFGRMLTFGWKFSDEKKAHVLRTDELTKDPLDDGPLTAAVAGILSKADIWVSWYGSRFDIPYVQSRMLKHRLGALPRTPHIDLWRTCRYQLHLHSNRLESAAQFLKCNTKTHLDGEIWQAAAVGQKKALDYIVDHNREDVLMLEKVYMHLRPLVQNHPNVNLLSGRLMACPVCGSRNLQKRGWRLSKTRRSRKYVCGDCTSWSTGPSQPVDGVEIR